MRQLTPLVIIGAGGHGREVLDIVEAMNSIMPIFEFLGFLDDGPVAEHLLEQRGARVIGDTARLAALDCEYIVGIGRPDIRERFDRMAMAWNRQPAVLVHPAASVGTSNRIGPGVVIAAGARLTTNVSLGRHVHLNVNSTVSHDCVLGDYVTVNPGANISGSVSIGNGTTLGTGSSVIQGMTIGAGTMVGAGAAVVRDLSDGVTAVGVPARPR